MGIFWVFLTLLSILAGLIFLPQILFILELWAYKISENDLE